MKIRLAQLDEVKRRPAVLTKESLIERYSGVEKNWTTKKKTKSLVYVSDNLSGTHHHANYLEYLETAWGNHYGIVITPDILWHTLISEAVSIVGQDSKKYAHLFTKSPDKKQDIKVYSESLTVMPLETLIDAIKEKVPTNTDIFLPEFTTTTKRAWMTRYASFADLVSPYYNYMMYLCGIPHIDVRGTREDYQEVAHCWSKIGELLVGNEEYFFKTSEVINSILENINSANFWLDIFKLDRCGSGSQYTVEGWWSNLYHKQPSLKFVENYASHLAKVRYKQMNTNQDYEMYQGLLCSSLEDGCLEPEFGGMIYSRPEQPIVEDFNPYIGQTRIYN